jgi:Ca-activated chloride channel homolog
MTLCYSILASLLILATLRSEDRVHCGHVPDMRVNSDLVLINALVTDRHGQVITGLDASDFRVFEDGREQALIYCANEDVPVSVALVLDTSGSIADRLDLLKQAATRFVRAANPADEYLLLKFAARAQVVLPFTTDTGRLLRAIASMEAGGSTALFDAVHLAVQEMRHARNTRKAVVIISDGVDNHSRYHEGQIKRLVSEIDFPLYAINVWQPQYGNRYAIERREPGTLELLSALTGGRAFDVRDLKKVPTVTELISLEIRHQYVLGYVPPNRTSDGKFRKVRVNVGIASGQALRISYRRGYHAPTK